MPLKFFSDENRNICDKTCYSVSFIDRELNHLLMTSFFFLPQDRTLPGSIKKEKMIYTIETLSCVDHALEIVKEFIYLAVHSLQVVLSLLPVRRKANEAMYPLVDTVLKFSR